ncbi:uncharacterized protein LOC144133677 [Amblyomma americanum]
MSAPDYDAQQPGQHQELVVLRADAGHITIARNSGVVVPITQVHHLAPRRVGELMGAEVLQQLFRDLVQAACALPRGPVFDACGAFTSSGLHGVGEDEEELVHLLLALGYIGLCRLTCDRASGGAPAGRLPFVAGVRRYMAALSRQCHRRDRNFCVDTVGLELWHVRRGIMFAMNTQ